MGNYSVAIVCWDGAPFGPEARGVCPPCPPGIYATATISLVACCVVSITNTVRRSKFMSSKSNVVNIGVN